MMGQSGGDQVRLFYSFNLDQHVPADHLLRGIERYLDLGGLRQHLAPFYSHTGRPSVDPELMMRMLLVGYCFGIRSERRLCEEVHLNLAYRWFCRLGLEDAVPDHSTFSKNRHGRFRQSDAFRHVFETVLQRLLVGAPRFELGTPCTPCKCATRLRHAPTGITDLSTNTGDRGNCRGQDDTRLEPERKQQPIYRRRTRRTSSSSRRICLTIC